MRESMLPLQDKPTDRCLEKIWSWNTAVPKSIEKCVHDLFAEQAKAQPDAPAICAWDGEMTYGELDALSSRLAYHLVQLGVKTEDIVPLCFEKSMWTVVAILAVLKAGGAFAPMDPDQPANRHQEILRQTSAKVMLVAARHSARWISSGCHVVIVSEASIGRLPAVANMALSLATPGNAAYVLYTSGTTGVPKGVVAEHRAVSTGCLGHGLAFGITSRSRVLQFASYIFTDSMTEIITTLLFGGCICVPSDYDRRNDLINAVNKMNVDWAVMTPSVAQLLNPDEVRSLKTLAIGAELVSSTDWNRWPTSVRMINGYGQTECCTVTTAYTSTQGYKSGTIGTAIASVSWVVDPENHHRLAPLGSIGELLVEGPILARGYLNDAEKTAATFINSPIWLQEGYGGHAGRHGRLYKTGDLVYYHPDGNLVYVGRKDTQVKLRGQRVELDEIEHHMRQCLPEVRQMAVEVVQPSGKRDHAILAAFVQLDDHCRHLPLVEKAAGIDSRVHLVSLAGIKEELAKRLPMHMVPTLFLALEEYPMNTSGKTDRRRLREIGDSFTVQKLAEMQTFSQEPKRQPSTEAERMMQQLWARVLSIEPDSIGLDDSFFRLGGDSIAAMKLVSEARKTGLQLSVADIFRHPNLAALANQDTQQCSTVAEEVLAFSLLGEDVDSVQVCEDVAAVCSVDASIVEDVYPCSPLQEGLMSLTAKRAGDYIMQSVLELRADIDEDTFRAAWQQVAWSTAALRTRIVQHSELGLLQAVVAEDIQWIEVKGLEEYLKEDKAASMGLGDPLVRYALVKEHYSGRRWFVWTIHHALYDGWSLPRILHAVQQVYSGAALEKQPSFNAFIQYLNQQDQEVATSYWQTALADCEAVLFPSLPSAVKQPIADTTVAYQCPPLSQSATDITTSTLIRAAWAIVASRYTSSDDVVFGTTVTGRNAPVAGIDAMLGPTIATVPVRVRVQDHQTVSSFLQGLQQQATEMIAHEQTGLQKIAKMRSGARHACDFQTLLVVQPADSALDGDDGLGEWRGDTELQDITTYALMVQCTLAAEGVQIMASFDRRVIEQWIVEKMLAQFSFVMLQLADASADSKVAEIDTITPADRQQLWAWNQDVPPTVERCVHDLFAEKVKAQPDAPAICAWDGEMTYSELDALSSQLAGYLMQLGVKGEEVVPLCFEKSIWTVVAMLAVLKAGGAFVPLDPDHPTSRHEEIFGQTRAEIMLTSAQYANIGDKLCRHVVTVSEASMSQLPKVASAANPSVKPGNAAYIIFTSGSTAVPKGVVVEHRAMATSCLGHGQVCGITEHARVLQFASYAFDACIAEIITTLMYGGCVCVPSDSDRRNNLANAINAMDVNCALLTPSIARLLDPSTVPTLRILVIQGEQVSFADWDRWSGSVRIMNAYGPTECTICCNVYDSKQGFKSGIIGTSVASVSWVVDPENYNRLAPLGSVGELLVEGPILARSYLNDAEKTSAAFVNDPAWLLEGCRGYGGRRGRLYKTGDLVQYDSDGNLVCLGRKDSQVKVRGQRVELGEVEHYVRECLSEAKQLAVEVIVPGEGGRAMLAAFVQINNDTNNALFIDRGVKTNSMARVLFLAEVEAELAERLPRHMVPTVFFALFQFPMTTSGKTDRKQLRKIGASFTAQQLAEMRTSSQGPKRQPSTEAERMMQQLWARVLSIEPDSIGLDDSFFRLGGDSIAAMKLVGEARRMGQQLSVADIFRHPRLVDVASTVICTDYSSSAAILPVDHDGPVEQSFAQGRLWFLEELHPGLNWYLMPFAVRIRGPLQLEALNAALLAIESRHETLRTLFATDGGVSMQVVQPFCAKQLNVIELPPGDEHSRLDAIQQDQMTPFDLRSEPGWRVSVYRFNKDDYVLSIVMHHIVSDGWSVDVLTRELSTFYSASIRGQDPLSQMQPLPIQYRDFSLWQRQEAQAEEHEKQLNYWLTQLQTSRPAELLCDKPRPVTLSGKADTRTLEIGGPLYAKLQQFCKVHGVTLFVALLAVFRTTHFRLTGQDDATIGTLNANRDHWELKDMIGFFANMQCLRITVENESFEELVQQVRAVVVASLANQDVPFESIVSKLKNDRDLSHYPLVQLAFVVHSQRNLGQLMLEGVETEGLDDSATSRFDLEFHFFQHLDGLQGNVIFSTDLYAPETIENMLSVFNNVLEICLREPTVAVASLPLLTDTDYAKLDLMGLVQIEETPYPRESSIVDLFREQVFAYPSRIAVKDSSVEMTYAQLDKASDIIATWLCKRSFGPESLVGVFAHRCCHTVVAFLGILKAGLAYLPFDVKTPSKRMEAVLSSLPGKRLIFVGAGLQPPNIKLNDIVFVHIAEVLDERTDQGPGSSQLPTAPFAPSASSLAYVMFTSGSTGKPKGVMVEHRGVVRLARDNNLVQHLPVPPIMAHISNLAFDASTWEIYASLLNGGTLVCIDAISVLDPVVVLQIVNQSGIQVAILTPALFRQYVSESPMVVAALKLLCVGGEALHPEDFFAAQSVLKGRLINCYGPTENTCISTMFVMTKDAQYTNGVPIGRALSNSGAYVMDSKLRLVPLGVIGELVVTGDGLARGYTEPKRNADRFVSVEIAGRTVKAYRTGDYVRHRPSDGQLEFFGRMDGQVKIWGQRIELGEIEHVLRSHRSVADAVTILQHHDANEVQLAGFVTMHEDAITSEQPSDGGNDEAQHVDVWEEQFDTKTYASMNNLRPEAIGRDFIGWTSMYDGSEIDKIEMNEWLDDTITTMLNGRRPGHVLEVGSGTGMILFNLGDGLESYVGLDPSWNAVEFVAKTVKYIPVLADRVRMHKATAVDLSRLEGLTDANLVVINSVVQYFPSQEYLFKVVQELLALDGVQTLFFGDIRSYALYQEFLATRALHIAGDKTTKAELRRMMADMERVERELLVDPAFFTALPSRLPDLVGHVEILPKKMKATNELSCYRYAAVVHVRGRGRKEEEIRHVGEQEWINFTERKLDRKSLKQQLKTLSNSPTIAISNIPYSKTIVSRCLVESLDDVAADTLGHQDWLSSVYQKAQRISSFSATDLVELAQEAGCRVEISWNRQYSQHGGLDAIFYQHTPKCGESRAMFRFPTDHFERPIHSLSSKPLWQQTAEKTQQQLRKMLQAQLPAYMVPQTITVLQALPINQNGKIDRNTLSQWRQKQMALRKPVHQPSTEAERMMQQLWARVLSIEPDSIGLEDSFFRLGGDSIAAMKLVSEARKTGLQLSVADIFRHPNLAALANQDTQQCSTVAEEVLAFSLLGEDVDSVQVCEDVAAVCSVDASIVEDVYPCSPLQEGLMSLTAKRAGDYIMQSVLELRADIDEDTFRAAWQQVAWSTAALRTRIVQHSELGLLQAVVAEDIQWIEVKGLEEYLKEDKAASMGLGDPLVRYALVKEHYSGRRWFVWTIHHALYDGWSLPRILHAVQQVYSGAALEKQPSFNAFIQYLNQQDQEVATSYWQTALAGCEAVLFPPLPSTVVHLVADTTVECQCPLLSKTTSDTTRSTLIRAAWAIVASRYTSSDDVVFGTTVTGRNAPVAGIDAMLGPTIATVPVRVRVQDHQTVSSFLQGLQQQATEMIAHEQTGLQRIAKMGPGPQHACGFQTLFVVQPADNVLSSDDTLGEWRSRSELQGFTTYALIVQCTLAAEGVQIMASFDRRVIEQWIVEKMLAQFSFVMLQLADASADSKVAEIDTITPADRQQLWAWNQDVPPTVERCVHDLFAEKVKAQPDAPAICAWDGEMTYSELDALSSQLAGYLVQLGVKDEEVVPLCFEKSIWTVVAMLAVLKAGGAFVPLDPDHPTSRHEEIFGQTRAEIMLTSAQYANIGDKLCRHVVTVSEASMSQLPKVASAANPSVKPGNAAYIIFTSGSTAVPKGVVVEHRAMATSCLGHGQAFGITEHARVLQFASYAFDACIAEIITTLMYGGCVCVPSDSDRRNNLANTINAMDVNCALLTPSIARLLDPSTVSTLRILVIQGEQVSFADWDRWSGSVQTMNGYGPTECTICCNVYDSKQGFKSGIIGTSVASVSWVVDPENYNRLAPLGSVGELLVEGPILARSYLNDAEKTSAAFVNDPAWLLEGCRGYGGRRGRLYKTGDLVQYDSDGNLVCLGRKDSQVKVRGQRVELGEVEHYVRECLSEAKQLAVEVIVPGEGGHAMLAAFVQINNDTNNALFIDRGVKTNSMARVLFLAEVEAELAERLPRHMVPTVFFALSQFPMTTSGKTDRKQLRKIGASFTAQQLAEMRTSSQGPKRQPSTEAERMMQQLWARVLSIEPNSIGLDDSFFRLGGDSIAAMKLVSEARKTGLQLSVADIFRHPNLAALANQDTQQCSTVAEEVPAFSLLGEDVDSVQVCEDVAAVCSVDASIVEDVYPCSPLQEGLMSLTAKRAGDYIMQSVLELRADIDEDTFRAAWQQVAWSTAALRTRIVQHSELGLLQAVVAEDIQWIEVKGLEEYLKEDKAASMGLGDPLVRYALVKEHYSGRRWFVWTIHHALYDGWSLPRILHAVQQVYSGAALEKQPSFNAFIQYLNQQDQEVATSYWQTALAGCEAVLFPPLPSMVAQPAAETTVEYQCPPLLQSATDITTSTLIRAAWAIVASRYTSSDDVVFGTTVTGRNTPVVDIDTIVGPTIATVPVRVRVQDHQTVSSFLQGLQQQATEMIAHEQTGLQRIAKMGPGPQHACGFQTLFVVQPADNVLSSDDTLGEWRSRSELQDFTTYALMVQCTLAAEGVQIMASFDRRVIEQWTVEKMLAQFSFVMLQLADASADSKVAEIDTTTPADRQQLWAWNQDVPPTVERCVHDLFAEKVKAQPDAPAICAWDGEMTYSELDALSSQLAGYLVQLGVKDEEVVPLCFEKSIWTVVAMLAVLKAGGAFLLLDPSLPAERLAVMCRKVGSVRALASKACLPAVENLVRDVVVVDKKSLLQMSKHDRQLPHTQPTSTAYVIFTSGSTGEPKGCKVEHRSSCTAIVQHGPSLQMSISTRSLQFSSFSFAGCVIEMFLSLVHGSCICIPSDEERRVGLAPAMSRMAVNWAFLTPTVLDTIGGLESVPSLTTLCIGGEPIRGSQIKQWEGRVHLRQTYGSSELSGLVSSARLTSASTTKDVGKATTAVYWIVDANNHDRLAPLGAAGELLVEGAVLGRGYTDEVEKTAATFIETPEWKGSFCKSQSRFYKTGDLARYKEDGSIELLGRKDTQVKLRGQRIELGEIEHQARLSAAAGVMDLAVELIRPEDKDDMLACFVVVESSRGQEETDDKAWSATRAQAAAQVIQDRLEQFLPQYMVPKLFVPLTQLPTTATGKTNRRRLREIGASFTAQQLAEMRTSSQGPKRESSTEAERTMQQLWARVLSIEPNSIGLDDSFFLLGGDSIAAMKLVGEARNVGLQLSVADIFRHPKLAALASLETKQCSTAIEEVPAFSLLSPTIKDAIFSAGKPFGCSLPIDNVMDVVPASYMQESFIRKGVRAPREAFNYFFIDLGTAVDVQVLEASCCALIDHFAILRTHFVYFQDKLFQVVPRHQDLPFSTFEVDGPLAEESQAIHMQDVVQTSPLGLPTSFMLVRTALGTNRLIIRLSHAQYDGVCLPIMLRALKTIYEQQPLHPTTSFHNYLAYIRGRHSLSIPYWRDLLASSHITNITSKLRSEARKDTALRLVKAERVMRTPQLPAGLTMASLVSSAWAVVLSHISGEEDVVYGLLVAGRNSNLPGITELMGPCLNFVPFRAHPGSTITAAELLRSVQDQYISLGESDSMGFDDIVQHCTNWPRNSEFDSFIQHQNIEEEPEFQFAGEATKLQWMKNPFAVPRQLAVVSYPRGDNLTIKIVGNTSILTDQCAENLLAMICNAIIQLSGNLEISLAACKASLPACT